MKMSSCCWGSEGVWGGYPPPAIAGRTCCGGSGGGTPPDQLLADAAVGVRGGVPPLNQELPGESNCQNYVNCQLRSQLPKLKMLSIFEFNDTTP